MKISIFHVDHMFPCTVMHITLPEHVYVYELDTHQIEEEKSVVPLQYEQVGALTFV